MGASPGEYGEIRDVRGLEVVGGEGLEPPTFSV